jgi:effector-binding domain-containing protein
MSNEGAAITRKKVDDIFIASIRFRGQYEEIPKYFDKLYAQVKSYVSGSAICLYYGDKTEEGQDIEVCFPVSQAVVTEEIKSRTLEGGEMLCATHIGPYGPPEAAKSLAKTWQLLWTYTGNQGITVATDPAREVYLEDDTEHGDNAEKYVTELQIPLLLPRWLSRLAEGLKRFAGETARQEVMAGSEGLTADSAPREKAEWARGAMERLDAAVNDEETRRNIMVGCAHRFPKTRIERLRAEYVRLGNIDELLKIMHKDRSWGGVSFYAAPRREGNTIYITKVPYDPMRCQEATDAGEKRAYYCHCGLVRAAIRANETISRTYCYCGAGWSKQLWEGILEKPVRVEVLQSVLQGDDCCSFAIHLPLAEGA